MRFSVLSTTLAVAGSVSALPQSVPSTPPAPALPAEAFKTGHHARLFTLEDMVNGSFRVNATEPPSPDEGMFVAATCSNPRVRQEWDSYSDDDRQAFVNAVRCLQSRPPSGQFGQSTSRYEDFVALHQTLTPNIHSTFERANAKFLVWHRYYLWTFESVLRSDCGFDRAFPWFDETRYAGRFAQSSIFSSRWFGGFNSGNNCIGDGQFANVALNVGPGSGNQRHCLQRLGDDSITSGTSSELVDMCNRETSYANMASCSEGFAHGAGHNGIGGVMSDVNASPGDPVFWLHHAFIDRNWRIWQNADRSRVGYINGNDIVGNPLTLDTTVNVYDFRPTVRVRDILDTTGETLCYKYNY